MERLTKKQAWLGLMLLVFIEPAGFCLYWDVFKAYQAVGHSLGTVDYWTALGVDLVLSNIVAALASAAYTAVVLARRNVRALYKES